MGVEHILARISRIADLIEMDAKQEVTRQHAKSIRALVQLVERSSGVEELKETIQTLERDKKHCVEILTEIRDVARISEGTQWYAMIADRGINP